MKITLYIPKGKNEHDFVASEITEASNIKSKDTRKSVIAGLRKIAVAIREYPDGGVALFSDGEEIFVEPYNGIKKKYHCGHEYERIAPPDLQNTLLVVVDSKNAAIGKTDGENITVLWSDESLVPGKHHMGGQSQARFNRARREELKIWERKVGEHLLQEFNKDKYIGIKVGGCGMVKDQFILELPS